jgi:hypothetical protein
MLAEGVANNVSDSPVFVSFTAISIDGETTSYRVPQRVTSSVAGTNDWFWMARGNGMHAQHVIIKHTRHSWDSEH